MDPPVSSSRLRYPTARTLSSNEFKHEAVRLVTVGGHSRKRVARDPGVSVGTLRDWIRKLAPEGPVISDKLPGAEQRRQLRRELRRTQMERDVQEQTVSTTICGGGFSQMPRAVKYSSVRRRASPPAMACRVLGVSRVGYRASLVRLSGRGGSEPPVQNGFSHRDVRSGRWQNATDGRAITDRLPLCGSEPLRDQPSCPPRGVPSGSAACPSPSWPSPPRDGPTPVRR